MVICSFRVLPFPFGFNIVSSLSSDAVGFVQFGDLLSVSEEASTLLRVLGDRDTGGRLTLPNLRSTRPFLLTVISSLSSDLVDGVRFGDVLMVDWFLLLVDRIVLFS
mgnify:CR=1 FL=1